MGGELDGVAGPEWDSGDSQSFDLVDAVGSMPTSIGALGVEKKPTGAAASKRVRLDASPIAVVEQLHAEVVGGGEPNGLQRDTRTPRGDRGRRRPGLLVGSARQGRKLPELGGTFEPAEEGADAYRGIPSAAAGRATGG